MKRNIFLIIITGITVICIIAGAVRHISIHDKDMRSLRSSIKEGIRSGDFDFDFDDYYEDNDYDEEDSWNDFDFDTADPKSFDSEVIGEFTDLSVRLKVGALKIERGNKWEIKSKYSQKNLKPVYTLKNKKLSISQPHYRNNVLGNKDCRVIITVPFGVELDKLYANLDVGAIDLSGFDVKTGSVDTNVGAISISKVGFKDLDVESDVGAVSIDLIESVDKYDVNISSDLGGITINGHNAKRKYTHKGDSSKRLRVRTDIGAIEVN